MYSINIVGDGSLILPAYVEKIIHPPKGVSWVSKDQELDVEHIGFLLYHALILTQFAKTGIFKVLFVNFCYFLKDLLQIYLVRVNGGAGMQEIVFLQIICDL